MVSSKPFAIRQLRVALSQPLRCSVNTVRGCEVSTSQDSLTGQNVTATGPSQPSVQQRHLQASVVAAWQLTNSIMLWQTLFAHRPGCSVSQHGMTTCVTGHVAPFPFRDDCGRTVWLGCYITQSRRDRRLCLILFLALIKSRHPRRYYC